MKRTLANPPENAQAKSYLQGITSLPVLSIKPQLPFNSTLDKPAEKSLVQSYLQGITSLPVVSI